MNKIEELEKRIQKLELQVHGLNQSKWLKDYLDSRKHFGMNTVAASGPEFEKHVLHKYSKKVYKEKGFPEKFEKLDLKNILKTANEKGNRVEKFKYWSKLKHEIRVVLGEKYYDDYWMQLIAIAEYAWEYFQNHTLQYIIDKEKYLDYGGPRERTAEKEAAYNYYLYLKENSPELFYSNGRHKGGPIKKKVEPLLREKINKSDFDSMRSIWDYIREREK